MRAAVRAAMLSMRSLGINGISFVGDSNTEQAADGPTLTAGGSVSLASNGVATVLYGASDRAVLTVGERVAINYTASGSRLIETGGTVLTASSSGCTIQTATTGQTATDDAGSGHVLRSAAPGSSNGRWIYKLKELTPAIDIQYVRGTSGRYAGSRANGVRNQALSAAADPGQIVYYNAGINNVINLTSQNSAAEVLADIQADVGVILSGSSKHVLVGTLPPIGLDLAGTDTGTTNAQKRQKILDINAELRSWVSGNARLHLADIFPALIVSGSTTAEADRTKMIDGLHYSYGTGWQNVAAVVATSASFIL